MTRENPQSNNLITILSGIYMIALAIINLCPAIAILGCGGFLGSLGSAVGSVQDQTGSFSSSGAALNIAGGAIGILGLALLVLAVALVVVAFGLFTTKPWAYMGTLILNAIFIALVLIQAALGSNLSILQIVFIILSGAVIFLFATNQDIKLMFGRA